MSRATERRVWRRRQREGWSQPHGDRYPAITILAFQPHTGILPAIPSYKTRPQGLSFTTILSRPLTPSGGCQRRSISLILPMGPRRGWPPRGRAVVWLAWACGAGVWAWCNTAHQASPPLTPVLTCALASHTPLTCVGSWL